MTTELTILGWTLVLAIFQILLPSHFRNKETGIAYNASPRDGEGPPVGVVTARLQRAQKNLFETLPLFIAAVLIAHVADIHTQTTYWGAWLYLAARIAYVPLYGFGIPYIRSLVWVLSMVGLCLIIFEVLHLS
ncbi:MAG: hypothetical protein DI586_07105 [Micavibrio aeruginosavorus]|uniref:MAPEG family protein n=1 Tax=Micavibrio aeruginosavorus TaxID=349221 RepID=A0A2W5FLY6_9BACT|nr:MAG: hypothetical protein DI586_07105 [Micavibrio aeruginosavorus]